MDDEDDTAGKLSDNHDSGSDTELDADFGMRNLALLPASSAPDGEPGGMVSADGNPVIPK